VPVRAERVVGLRTHAGDVLAHLVELLAQTLRVGPYRADGALETEEAFDLLPQLERRVDLVAELTEPSLELVDLGVGAGDPLDLRLRGRDAGLGALHVHHLLLDRLAPLAEGVQVLGPLQNRRERAQLFQRLLRAGDERFECDRDVGTAGIDGDDSVVRAAAAFEEGDHGIAPRARRFGRWNASERGNRAAMCNGYARGLERSGDLRTWMM
jgi:hypothetical protein